MKESIKNNILRTLVDAKKELLEDCHINNM